MFPPVDTRNPDAVLRECEAAYREIAGRENDGTLARAFGWVTDAFAGRNPNYEPIDARYHDLEHTMQGTLCMARLLVGWHRAGGKPTLDERAVRLGLIAILLHDTGYLKARGDRTGSGAKYTYTHVLRSAEFAGRLLAAEGFPRADIQAVQSMIRCTGVNANVKGLPFSSELERRVGYALATADLLGQMAAPDYVEKLPILYEEFAEAAEFAGTTDAAAFRSADDLMRRTLDFWSGYVLPLLGGDFEGIYRFLNVPYPGGPNEYVQRVETNLARIGWTAASPS